tara:strand:- start:84 stop:647 length:564 start_codon:yes stop_codon:yes gene_type:complete
MAELIKVSLVSVNGNNANGDVLLNVDRIKGVYTKNSRTYLVYDYNGVTRTIGVTNSESTIKNEIGSYTTGRTMSVTTFRKNGQRFISDQYIYLDDLLWGDKLDEDADTFRLLFPDVTYDCAGSPSTFLTESNTVQSGGSTAFIGSYNTAARPSASGVTRGHFYFDTTLGMPSWSDGTNWVNSTGATI